MFSNKRKKIIVATIFVCILFFLIKFFTLSDYGINWDETARNNKGQAYVHYFLTGSKNYNNLNIPRRSIYQDDKYPFDVINKWVGHPPLGDILSSFSNYIFYQNLGIMSDTESYHLFYIAVCSILVGFLFYFTVTEYGVFVGVVATLSLVLYPLFFGESSFNFKDPVQASFYAIAVMLFYKAFSRNNWKMIIISSVVAGFALGIKFNILFAVFSFVPWLIMLHWRKIKKLRWSFSLKMSVSMLLIPIIAFGIVIISWPYLWQNPLKNLLNVFYYYKINGTFYYQPITYLTVGDISTFPIQWILYTTPIVILIFSFFGIIYSVLFGYKEKNKLSLLVLFWFLVPILRVTAPHTGIANGIREIIEYIPAMAILAGLGAKQLSEWISIVFGKRYLCNLLIKFLIILSFIPIMLKLISIHPNENVYFNLLIDGLKGAKQHQLPGWGNSFGNSYRQAATWMNTHAEKNAKAYLAIGYQAILPSVWLRKDIQYSYKLRQDYLKQKGEYIIEMTGEEPAWTPYCVWIYVRNFLNPVYEVKVDSVPILTIWKNDSSHTKPDFSSPGKQKLLNNCTKNDEI
jgi:hypothetical protein